jgi:hypothetical protein
LLVIATDWLVWVTAISTGAIAVGTAVLAGGIVVALAGLADARRTRHGLLLADLSRRWDEPVMVQSQQLFARYATADLLELVEKLFGTGGATNEEREHFALLEAVPNFWETLGVLQQDDAITTTVLNQMWGDAIRNSWRWEEPIAKLREAPVRTFGFDGNRVAIDQVNPQLGETYRGSERYLSGDLVESAAHSIGSSGIVRDVATGVFELQPQHKSRAKRAIIDACRARGELERDEVIDLQGAAVLGRLHPVLLLDRVLLGLGHVADIRGAKRRRADHRLGQLAVVGAW